MIALCTGTPKAETRDTAEQIVVTFPSGKDAIQIALTLDQALHLFQTARSVAIKALDHGFAAPTHAEVIAFSARAGRA